MKVTCFHAFMAGLALGTMSAAGQVRGTFADQPARRTEAVQRARQKAHLEKETARQWAAARGVPMRYDDGRRLIELMALRNGIPIYYSTQNHNAAISTGADQVRSVPPFNADGTGLTVGVWDGGSVLTDHQEFDGRVANSNGVASHYHSTHVGGTVAAAGIVANARGMAPGVNLDSYDWNEDIAEMTARAASYPNEPDTIYLSNHSYGTVGGWTWAWNGTENWYWPDWLEWGAGEADYRFGQYDNGAVDYDQVVYDAPYLLPFVSAGNDRNDGPSNGDTVYYLKPLGPGHVGKWTAVTYDDTQHPLGDGVYKGGYDNISAEATAKNIMTVGAIADAVSGDMRSVGNASMLSFSSWGPADDGRVKPDIVANGYQLYSCDDIDPTSYATLSGTSMAAPNACGSAVLLVDYYGQRFPGSAMQASTLKGLIIHTADDLGRPGPDYAHGWGLMNAWAAAELIRDYADGDTVRMTEAMLSSSNPTGDVYVYQSDGQDPIRATLCWTDPPGPVQTTHDSRSAVLVDDLDLKIIGPDGTNYPYRLDYAHPSSNAVANAENDIDNVEQVYIEMPAVGVYTILVDYDGALQDGEQEYSLLIDGLAPLGNPVDSDMDGMPDDWEMAYFFSATGAVASVDSDGDDLDNFSEYIGGYDPTDAASSPGISVSQDALSNAAPFVLSWNAVSGRVYTVGWSSSLSNTFTNISGVLYYPTTRYTDTVERAGETIFYRIGVQLAP